MRIVTVCLFLLLFALPDARAQSLYNKAQLEASRKEILNAIKETEAQLEAIKKDKNATLGQLRALQTKLSQRQRLITNINDELQDIDKNIKTSAGEVTNLKEKLEQQKIRYAQSIRYAYSSRSSYGMMAFLFSSHDFNDAMRRMKYLKKFRDFRKEQVDQIRVTQTQLQHKIGTLNAEKAQKDELLTMQVKQREELEKEKGQTDQEMQKLKGKEGQLMNDIEKNRATARRISNYIKIQIEKEMAEATRKAEEEARRKAAEFAKANPGVAPPKPAVVATPANTTGKPRPHTDAPTLMLTPTDVKLANDFESNRGKLYWPVDRGYITDRFGSHPHPAYPRVMIDNNGIDIQTDPSAPIRSIFEGTVTRIFSVTGSQQIVMIKHGNFFTVYNGLASVNVKKDDKVSARQVIGTVGNNDEGQPTINFQIYKNTQKVNPEQWIGKPR